MARRRTDNREASIEEENGAVAVAEEPAPAAPEAVAPPASDDALDPGTFANLELARLSPSSSNYRRTRDAAADDELADSMRAIGMLQPLTVRAVGDGVHLAEYEVVIGRRRYDAAKAAGLERVPCVIKVLTDAQVAEVQLVENVQRRDVDPLEEADAFAELVERFGYTLERLRQRTSKSASWVRERLALAALCPRGRELYLQGVISASHALEIARLQNPTVQVEALVVLEDECLRTGTVGFSVDDLRDVLRERFHLRMKDAPWKLDDAELVPEAGSCAVCPKRTRNVPELFPDDARAQDACTDAHCWTLKMSGWRQRREAELEAKGFRVLRERDARKALDRWGHAKPGWLRLDTPAPGDAQERSLGDALGKHMDRTDRAIVFFDGKPIELGEVEKVRAAAKAAKVRMPVVVATVKAPAAKSSSSGENRVSKWDEQQARAKLEQPAAISAVRAALAAIVREVNDSKGFDIAQDEFVRTAIAGEFAADPNRRAHVLPGAVEVAIALELVSVDDVAAGKGAGDTLAALKLTQWAGSSAKRLVWLWMLIQVADDVEGNATQTYGPGPLKSVADCKSLRQLCDEAGVDLKQLLQEAKKQLSDDEKPKAEKGKADKPAAKKSPKPKRKKGGRR